MSGAEGFVDLHCHLLPEVDDGAKTLADALEMARVLVTLGFTEVAPSPHHRPEYAPSEVAEQRRVELCAQLERAGIRLRLHSNAENRFLDERFLPELGTPTARLVGEGRKYVLVEAPYTSPLPSLLDLIFRAKLKGVTPLIAHPERCLEFEKPGRGAEAVHAGARLQLDVGALTGRYGPKPKAVARQLLDAGLYSVAATDLHFPHGAQRWVGEAMGELRRLVGERAMQALLADHPRRILRGEALES